MQAAKGESVCNVTIADPLPDQCSNARNHVQIRIRDTVESQEGVIMAYKIANLVQFYLVTMQRTIGEGATLTVALAEYATIATFARATT